MEEEKSNEYADWSEYSSQPWECMYRFVRSMHFRDGITLAEGLPNVFTRALSSVYYTGVQPGNTDTYTFRRRIMDDMVNDFFTKKTPRYPRLLQHAEKWIVWSVTRGRYRMNRCKRMWLFTGADTSCKVLNLKHGSKYFWENIECFHDTLEAITDTANELIDHILEKLKRFKTRSTFYKCALFNFKKLHALKLRMYERGHPSNSNTPAHRQRRWFFQPRKRGGNRGHYAVAKSEPLPIPSVHEILKSYHAWLPEMK